MRKMKKKSYYNTNNEWNTNKIKKGLNFMLIIKIYFTENKTQSNELNSTLDCCT